MGFAHIIAVIASFLLTARQVDHTMSTLVQIHTPDDLGKAVRKVRKAQGITQSDLALIAGKSHVLLRDIETGKGTVSLASVLLVMQELGIRLYMDIPGK